VLCCTRVPSGGGGKLQRIMTDVRACVQLWLWMCQERHMRREQVEDARRRRQQRMALEEQERQQNNRIFAEKEAKRKAEERAKVRENRQWLKEVRDSWRGS